MSEALVHREGLPPGTPGTHVLVIGIGHYPHLPDGGGRESEFADGMRQLGSPPASARAIADWFLTHHDDPERPLASVGLILSEPGGEAVYINPRTGQPRVVPSGSADDVRSAVRDWVTRMSDGPGNVAVFYFCGHGITQGMSEILLLRDFGEDLLGPFDGTMDLTDFKAAMEFGPADEQVFLIDACRVAGMAPGGRQTVTGTKMLQMMPRWRQGRASPLQSVHQSTAWGEYSYAFPDQVSVFATAVLEALSGAAEQDDQGRWWVNTTHLHDSVGAFMKRALADQAVNQVPDTTRASRIRLTALAGVPNVPVFVYCKPREHMSGAVLRCHGEVGLAREHDGRAGAGMFEWRMKLAVGFYDFTASFDPNLGMEAKPHLRRFIYPPFKEICFMVEGSGGTE